MFETLPNTPPTDMVMPASQTMMLYMNVIPAVIALIIALFYWRKTGSAAGVLCLIGGAFAVCNEPLVDNLGLVWFAAINSWTLMKVWGISIPIFMLPVYVWYVGGQAFLSYWLYRRGLSTGGLFRLYGVFALTDIALEISSLHYNTYTYYGLQPFTLFKFPLWWAIVNGLMPMLLGAVVFKLEPLLRGLRKLLLLPVLLMVSPGANGMVVAPVWFALHADGATLMLTSIAAVLSLGLGLLVCAGLGLFVAKSGVTVAVRGVPGRRVTT